MTDDIPDLDELADQPGSGLEYVPVCDPCPSSPAAPPFVFGASPPASLDDYLAPKLSHSAGLYVAANLSLFERALLIHDGVVQRCEKVEVTRQNVLKFLPLFQAKKSALRHRQIPGSSVLLLGRGYHVWGHWLVDFLPKLAILALCGYDLSQLKYLIPNDTPAFGIEILDLAGIGAAQRIFYDPHGDLIRPESLLIPTLVRCGNRPTQIFPAAVINAPSQIRNEHLQGIAHGPERIFVSRGALADNARRLLNRERIERMAEDAGFTILHPETMSPLEQFAVFSTAHDIAGEAGSALHTSIFARSGTTVCSLQAAGPPLPFLQSTIGAALGQPTGYVFGEVAREGDPEAYVIPEDGFGRYLEMVDRVSRRGYMDDGR
jgi:hypothetical protein